jgi:uncharacterized protein YbjT (DUF2867 family)
MNESSRADLTVLVSGATGQQGGAVARHLLGAGFHVRALTRDPEGEAAQRLAAEGAEVVGGDLEDRTALDRALKGAYGVFSVQNFGEAGVEGEVRQGKALADAARGAGVGHFLYSSVGSAHRNTGIPHFDSKFAIEEHVRSSGLPHTILRPVFLMENWEWMGREAIHSGTLSFPLDPGKLLQQIAVDDIGVFAALAFSNPDRWLGRAVDLAGDELTMPEVAGAFGRVIGRPVEYVEMPMEQARQMMGEEGEIMLRWFNDVGYEADIAALRQEHPGLTTLEGYLRAHGWEG